MEGREPGGTVRNSLSKKEERGVKHEKQKLVSEGRRGEENGWRRGVVAKEGGVLAEWKDNMGMPKKLIKEPSGGSGGRGETAQRIQ